MASETLCEAVDRVTKAATASGFLCPLEARLETVPFEGDATIPPWVVRVRAPRPAAPVPIGMPVVTVCQSPHRTYPMPSLATSPVQHLAMPSRTPSPFCPPEPETFVTALPSGHNLLLNRFPAITGSLLICTPDPLPQNEPLAPGDLAALEPCVREAIKGRFVCFYNCGQESGSSQPTRHMQAIPLDRPYALDEIFSRHVKSAEYNVPSVVPGLPFLHAVCRPRPGAWHEAYAALLKATESGLCRGHNWLCTGDWALVVPRSRDAPEGMRGVSLNSLAFLGTALCRGDDSLESIKRVGFMNMLAQVGVRLD